MAVSENILALRNKLIIDLAARVGEARWVLLRQGLQADIALRFQMDFADLLREARRALQSAETDDECIAAMRTASTMLRLIADDLEAEGVGVTKH